MSDTARDRLERIAMHMRMIRGAQWDMLNGRPDMDSMEEIEGGLALIERELQDD